MKLTLEQANEWMNQNEGNLDLRDTQFTELPDDLTVGGSLFLNGSKITTLPDNLTIGRNLDLSRSKITELPDDLTVGWFLDLSDTPITSLPDDLTVRGSLYLNDTPITSLPDNLTVGGSLDLCGSKITALPERLTVIGFLDLRGTPITSLPDDLTVGGNLDLSITPITSLPDHLTIGGNLDLMIDTKIPIEQIMRVRHLQNGDYVKGRYLYADDQLTHVKKERKVDAYTLYVGKIKNQHVVSDGTHYAHCKNVKEGIEDLHFKGIAERGANQYKHLTKESLVTMDEAITMYRVITGACRAGVARFVENLHEKKKQYTLQEVITITKEEYKALTFEGFFA